MNELKIPTNLECNSIETISLNEQRNYRLTEKGKLNYAGKTLTIFFNCFLWDRHFCPC